MADTEVPVLIVGGSLVGMFSAALLARQGIYPFVVERHRGTAIHPRAAFLYQRSMEIVRSFGIEDIVRRESYRQFEPDGAIMSVESIAGQELAWDVPTLNEHVKDLSPTERLFITQNALEPMLKVRAEEYGADLRFGTELVSFEGHEDGVTGVVRDRDSGATTRVRAAYMIGADGNRSQVRNQLGIAMRGRGLLSKSLTIYFRADVTPLLRGRNLSVIMVRNPTFRGFFRIEKPYQSGFLVVNAVGDPDAPVADVWDLSEERCLDLVRSGLGVDVPVTIESIQRWECVADVADRFRERRVFLAGDAAHVMPPYGGFGGNTGIHDAHNLTWKLALVLKGIAGEALLDSYELERRPVAVLTAEQAYTRYVVRGAHYLAPKGVTPFVNDLNIDLGYRYRSTAVISDSDDDGAIHGDPRESRARPGTRAPHIYLEQDGVRASTLDICGRDFVLFAGADGSEWMKAARKTAATIGIKLDAYQVGEGGLGDPDSRFETAYGISSTGAVLVRPDYMVGWRATSVDADPEGTLTRSLKSLLSRE